MIGFLNKVENWPYIESQNIKFLRKFLIGLFKVQFVAYAKVGFLALI